MNTKVIVMTPSELKELLAEARAEGNPQPPAPKGKRYVYGLRGIRDLFNVSHTTAQKYKDSFLKPAVTQRGRKIIVDAEMAIELFGKHQSA